MLTGSGTISAVRFHTLSMEVSIIIPVFDDAAGLSTTLTSIRQQNWDSRTLEVIVCNDGGGKDISRICRAFDCLEARLDTRNGAYAARNAGLRASRGRVLAFIDADETATPSWLDAGMAAIQHSDYVGGRILVDPGSNPRFWQRSDSAHAFPVETYIRKLGFAPTANLFVRRDVFRMVGVFNEALQSGGDREFGARVREHRLRQTYCAEAMVVHPARDLAAQLVKARRTARGTSQLEVLCWHRSASALLGRSLLRTFLQLARGAVLGATHVVQRFHGRQSEPHLLAAGRAMVDCFYNSCVSAHSLRLLLRRPRPTDSPAPLQ